MSRLRQLLAATVGALALIGAAGINVGASESTLVEFNSMTGVSPTGINVTNDRGLKAGGAPWVISTGIGEVDRQGNLEIQVKGLIIPVLTPPRNPVGTFSAAVSCLTPDGPMNAITGPVATGPAGDASFATTVDLPHPCKSPEVFVGLVRNGAFIWFAQSNPEGDD